jgi:hypothetical protein
MRVILNLLVETSIYSRRIIRATVTEDFRTLGSPHNS